MHDIYCTFCAAPLTIPDNDEPEIIKAINESDLAWLGRVIGIHPRSGELNLKDLKGFYYNQDGGFEKDIDTSSDHDDTDSSDDDAMIDTEFWGKIAFMHDLNDGAEYGIIVHMSCYQVLNRHGLVIDYADMWNRMTGSIFPDLICDKDYCGIEQYLGQFMNYQALSRDGNVMMIKDPEHDSQNRSRLLDIWQDSLNRVAVPAGG